MNKVSIQCGNLCDLECATFDSWFDCTRDTQTIPFQPQLVHMSHSVTNSEIIGLFRNPFLHWFQHLLSLNTIGILQTLGFNVLISISNLCERVITVWTIIWLFSSVNPNVHFAISSTFLNHATKRTRKLANSKSNGFGRLKSL